MIAPSVASSLLETIETQRAGCELAGSPLYASVLEAVAGDVSRGGPSADLLGPVADAPFGDAVLLRFLGALHRAVLSGSAPGLAAHYPSVGGRPQAGLAEAVVAAIEAHRPAIATALVEGVQTNEVGRSATLLGGLLELAALGLPLRLREVGSSAGLNLLPDRYRYVAGDRSFGPVDSPLAFRDPWVARVPELGRRITIESRRGSDVHPVDVTTEAGRLRLRSFVWADQLPRLARLDAALEVARADPPQVDRADAAEWLAAELAEPAAGVCTVVTHSIMFQYLSAASGRSMLTSLDEAGARATPEAPLAWLRMEPGGDQAELRLTTWPSGVTHLLATSAYHGPPIAWRAPDGGVLRAGAGG